MSTEIAIRDEAMELSVNDVKRQVTLIHTVMQDVMQEGVHYGTIPGVAKPSLLKAGAEKLGLTFRLAPEFKITRADLPNGHREFEIVCTLRHIVTGAVLGEGVGSCSTMESKYRYRKAERVCPKCGQAAIIKGKAEYGGGWLCFAKRGGCGAKWPDGAAEIEKQETGRAENIDIADTYNTVLKMAKKRAHVDAMLTATAASDILTQDVEDMTIESGPVPTKEKPVAEVNEKAEALRAEVRKYADDLVMVKKISKTTHAAMIKTLPAVPSDEDELSYRAAYLAHAGKDCLDYTVEEWDALFLSDTEERKQAYREKRVSTPTDSDGGPVGESDYAGAEEAFGDPEQLEVF